MNDTGPGTCSGDRLALVVDDEDTARMVARRSLERSGFVVREASDGAAAMALLAVLHPDVILLDVEMEPLDGFATCERIRRLPAMANTPIVMMTAHDDAESIDRAYRAGATDFATKPVNWPLLHRRLRYVMRAAETISELATAQRIAGTGAWRWTIAEGFTRWSESMRQMSGIERPTNDNVLGRVCPEDRQRLIDGLRDAHLQRRPMELVHRFIGIDDTIRVVEHRAEPMVSHSGEVLGLIGTVHDITVRETALRRVRQLAFSDEVTNLPNRRAFRERLDAAIERADARGAGLALLYLDIDDFKRVNDSLGHATGDLLLRAIALRLGEVLRRDDVSVALAPMADETGDALAARFGGDEFAVLLEGVADEADAVAVATRVSRALSLPIRLDEKELTVTPSIGIALYPRDAEDSDNLLRSADTAMYAAKREGKNGHRVYDRTLSESACRRLALETELRGALERGELALHYQPQVSVRSGALAGVEALLRWHSPVLGPVSPLELVPLAEETGLILPIGEWVLGEACRRFKAWRRDGIALPRIAVNISMRQFGQVEFVERVAVILAETGMVPACLELEITESMLAVDGQGAIDKLHALKALGVAISIDDFGTGYSSLSYLKRFPIDRLKIDRSFIKDIDRDRSDVAITTSIVGLARGLGLGVVAEGVESQGHLDKLLEIGCDEAQGYLLARPLPEEALVRWMRDREAPCAASASRRAA